MRLAVGSLTPRRRPASVMRTFRPIPITRPVSSASASGIGSRRIAVSIQPCQLSSRPLVRRCGNLSTHIASKSKAILPEAVVNHRVVVFVRPYLGNLAYAALASGFLMTDIFSLRLLLISGYSGLVSYHILQRIPMRIPLRWSAFFVAVNTYMLVQLARDLYPGEFDPEDEALYIEARRPLQPLPHGRSLALTSACRPWPAPSRSPHGPAHRRSTSSPAASSSA